MTRPHDAQTPRTDAKVREIDEGGCLPDCDSYGHNTRCPIACPEIIMIDFAAQLELELQAERERGRRVREETIEECAKVCDPGSATDAISDSYHKGYMAGVRYCFDAIRAISRAESAPEGGKDEA